jgi:hypothetical protein
MHMLLENDCDWESGVPLAAPRRRNGSNAT